MVPKKNCERKRTHFSKKKKRNHCLEHQSSVIEISELFFFFNLLTNKNIGTLSVQELFFQLIGLLGGRLGVSPVGMVELFVHGASLTT